MPLTRPDDRPPLPYIHVAEVVVRDPATGRVALVRNHGTWWLPGGRVEHGETFAEAGRREVLEETGLEVEVQGVLGVTERIEAGRHLLFVTLSGDVVGGSLRPPENDPKVDAVTWASVDAVRSLTPEFPVRPVILAPRTPVPYHA